MQGRCVETPLAEADVLPRATNHEVVEDVDAEKITCSSRFSGKANILGARRRIARGMVVDQEDRRGSQANGVAKAIGETDHRSVQPTLVDEAVGDDAVLAIQANHSQLLLGQ